MTHIYTPQTTMWAGRYGSLTLMLAPLRSELRRKRPARIFTRIVIRSSPAVTSSGVCRYAQLKLGYYISLPSINATSTAFHFLSAPFFFLDLYFLSFSFQKAV
uniref:Germanicol synthase n=1 Tax=Rhizophora mucronata TaxID=61149 RepID=A0A2P2MS00_RHIMU